MSFLETLSRDLTQIDVSIINRDTRAVFELNHEGQQVYDEISSLCRNKAAIHPQWLDLSGRVKMYGLKQNLPDTFSKSTELMKDALDKDYYAFVMKNADVLDSLIIHDNDYRFNIFAIETLRKSYLAKLRVDGAVTIVETPQYMYLRVATFLWFGDISRIKEVYGYLTEGCYSHASPTLFNAGFFRPQLASCFTMTVDDDMQSIAKSWHDTAIISMNSGGIGVDYSSIRHSEIGHSGFSEGVIPWIKVEDRILIAANQAGRRKGSGTAYLTDWHLDIEEFLDLKEATGPDEMRARDMTYALWISDEFMRRVRDDTTWTLFCPKKAKGLEILWGVEFESSYKKYEERDAKGFKNYTRTVKARDLWKKIILSQIHTGMPFILYKDAINRKTNQQNLGTIRLSNLCVAGDTKILTRNGQIPIQDLEGKEIDVWNGEEWSGTTVFKTGTGKDLLKITCSNGAWLECTPEHYFYVQSEDEIVQKSAQDLSVGDLLIKYNLPEKMPCNGLLTEIYNAKEFMVDNRLTLQEYGHDSKVVECDNNLFKLVIEDNIDVTISKIEKGSTNVDTFCFTEKNRHMGMFNGILTGQCTEITLYTDKDNIGSCNLGSIVLNSCVDGTPGDYANTKFDFEKLERLTASMIRNINQCIDRNYYPDDIPQIESTNLRNRPIGLGVMGLADVFALLDLSWLDQEAKDLNKKIFETMYYAAVKESIELAKIHGAYETFKGSPMSRGLFQFDMWDNERVEKAAEWSLEKGKGIDVEKILSLKEGPFTERYDWETLRKDMVTYGVRNSLLLALMPTATSAQILGNNECFEPYTQHIYARTVLSGQFVLINPHMVRDFEAIDMWNTQTVRTIWAEKGSIQSVLETGSEEKIARIRALKKKYLTVFELPQKRLLHMHADRSRYICQTSSFNCFFDSPTFSKLNAFHFEGWKRGVKTGMYYLRQTARTDPMNFSLDSINVPRKTYVCTDDICTSCSV